MSNVTTMPTPSRPAPLVPPECCFSGHDSFPLKGDRMRKSKWWRRASDLARARNVMLWWEAYKSCPAGSLPDDDDDLAEAAGFGLDTDAFLAVKAEIMAPWVLCSDGRWYHPTVCEVVLENWESLSDRRRAGAKRQANYRAKTREGDAHKAPDDASRDDEPAEVTPKTEGVTRDSAEVTRHRGGKEKKGEERKGEESPSPNGDSSSADADDGQEDDLLGGFAPAPSLAPIKPAFDAYNRLAVELGLPIAKTLNETRRKALKARLREHGLDGWNQALDEIRKSDFLQGKTDRWGGADLDFVLQAKSFQRLIEGFYSRGGKPPTGGGRQSWV